MTVNTTVATLDSTASIERIDRELRTAIADDDAEQLEPTSTSPAKLTKAEREAAAAAEAKAKAAADRKALQALVPWKVIDGWGQRTEVDNWMDDSGHFPRTYRAYSREEWRQAIKTLADTVAGLTESHPEYQRASGLYIEAQTDDFLLIRSKKWQFVIQIPGKVTASGKRLDLGPCPGREAYYMSSERPPAFAELITSYVPVEQRDTLLDICCQYLREMRICVNRATWGYEHPELAHLLDEPKR